MYYKQPIPGLTQEWFRELSFSRLECGVPDRLHIYPLCEIFYFPWHIHRIEGTDGIQCLIRKAQPDRQCGVNELAQISKWHSILLATTSYKGYMVSNVESQVFILIYVWSKDRTPAHLSAVF